MRGKNRKSANRENFQRTLRCGLFLCSTGLANARNEVAFDDLGNVLKEPHVIEGSGYTWPKSVPATVTDRTIAHGPQVRLAYTGADAAASYTAEIVTSADETARQLIIEAGGRQIGGVMKTPAMSELTTKVTIPPAAHADGRIDLVIRNTGGEGSVNAAVSSVRIFSSSSAPLRAWGTDISDIQYTPIPVTEETTRTVSLLLNGTWKFSPAAPASFSHPGNTATWADIEVPGQWINQGFDIPATQATGYHRDFEIPADWKGKSWKLRFDAVFSTCEVFVNGSRVGSHTGGFTPFEIDVTRAARIGANTLRLKVTSDSLADLMASASKYACHPLGGISRDVRIFAVPETHLKDVFIRTDFDAEFVNADLLVDLDIEAKEPADAQLRLLAPDGSQVFSETRRVSAGKQNLQFPVTHPRHWTPDTPELHWLEITLAGAVTRHPVGFREISVDARNVLVNGKPVRLKGVNRHETHPLRGRSMPAGQWEKDLLLFRNANVNHIRTCHYPPSTLLGEAADKHGMWLEVEGPFCWENSPDDPTHRDLTVRQLAEMVLAWRNHPSVLFWSIANESRWGRNFAAGADVMAALDPSRERTFNWMSPSVDRADEAWAKIGAIHYPGFSGAGKAKAYPARPLYFGEYAHLNAYNRREMMTDPGLRSRWGEPFSEMWESMWTTPSVLGGAIWAGIDDTFFFGKNTTAGYGAWGPIDPWRRPKPEWWNMKKVYSPIHLTNGRKPEVSEKSLVLSIQNRGDFLNFSQLEFEWSHDGRSGTASADIPPHQEGKLVITPPQGIIRGKPVELRVTAPGGREVDRFSFPTGDPAPVDIQTPAPVLADTAEEFTITQGNVIYHVAKATGNFSWTIGGKNIAAEGPRLLFTPLNGEGNTQMSGPTQVFTPFIRLAEGSKPGTVAATSADGRVTVTIPWEYTEAEGSFTFIFAAGKPVTLDYKFTMKSAINPRQTGIAFDLPGNFRQLEWTRNGQWNWYPADHIGRLQGTAEYEYAKGKPAIEIGPREEPELPWSQDNTAYGSNDFRSTKENIRRASLRSPETSLDVFATEDGTHIQAIGLDGKIRASLLNYSNAGNERFLQRLSKRHFRSLPVGASLSGSIRFTAGTGNSAAW